RGLGAVGGSREGDSTVCGWVAVKGNLTSSPKFSEGLFSEGILQSCIPNRQPSGCFFSSRDVTIANNDVRAATSGPTVEFSCRSHLALPERGSPTHTGTDSADGICAVDREPSGR